MKNILPYTSSVNEQKSSYSYTIDWSLFEGEIEYDYITEELKIVFSKHGDDQASNYKITHEEIEEIIGRISNMLINAYNRYDDNMEKPVICTIRDRSKKIPFEIITIIENDVEKKVKKENVAITGEMFNYSKIKKIEDEVINKGLHRERIIGENGMKTDNPKLVFVDLLKRKESEGLTLDSKDYVFKVITCRRKKDFIPNSAGQIAFDVFPDKAVKMNGDDLRTSMM